MTPILLLLTAVICLATLAQPWVGALAYYLLGVGQPQAVWTWIFQDLRISLFVTLATVTGFALSILMRRLDFGRLKQPQNLLMLVLWALVNLSRYFGSYTDLADAGQGLGADFILSYFNKILFFYFIAVLLIDDWRKLKALLYVLCGIVLYYTWWANNIYLSGQYWRFGDNGRLNGPEGLYHDENTFALLFVIGTPVLYYTGLACRWRLLRYALWLAIPLSWHALFLTSSRGGLLALAVVCVYLFLKSYSKSVSIILTVGLVVAVLTQGVTVLNRVDDTGADPSQEVADPRLISWEVGTQMFLDYPLFGVGVGNFVQAFSDYSHTNAHVAHNTFLQFAANSGLGSGLIYLWLFVAVARQYRKEKRAGPVFDELDMRTYSGDLIRSAMLGFFVVALFLDLMLFELFYMLLIAFFVRTELINQEHIKASSEARAPLGFQSPG